MEKLRIHYFQHVPFEGLGCIEDWAGERGHRLTATRWYASSGTPDVAAIDWLIVMGGPMGVYDEDRHPWLQAEKQYIAEAIAQKKKVLGICLGAQLIAGVLGARVYPNEQKEIGWFPVQFSRENGPAAALSLLFPPELTVFHWHSDTFDLPPQAVRFASTPACANQAFVYDRHVIGLQFHFEITPRALQEMLQFGEDELTPAPSVQSAGNIMEQSHLAVQNNTVMYRLLDYIADRDSTD